MNAHLDVIAVVSNPRRYQSRYRLYRKFAHQMLRNRTVRLTTVEIAHGSRPFEVTDAGDESHVQLRSDTELWQKEAMINVGVSRLPADATHVAWIDADVQFVRPDWAEETVQALEHYRVVQPFSQAIDLGPKSELLVTHQSFASCFQRKLPWTPGQGTFWHPGYAWAMKRETLEKLGGLMDWPILGAADHHMATAFIGKVQDSIHGGVTESYKRKCIEWQERAKPVIEKNIGCVDGVILHDFHGKKKDRKYQDRWQILVENAYDPDTDVEKDAQGLWALKGNKLALRDGLRGYLAARNEDSTDAE